MHTRIESNIIIIVCICLITCLGKPTHAIIGINWGKNSVTNLIPSMVVDLLLQNGIRDVKVYNGDVNALKAFSGTNIRVTTSIRDIKSITSVDKARDWITATLKPFPDVNFKYVSVGNGAFNLAKYANLPLSSVVDALNYTQQALDELGYKDKVTAIISNSVYGILNLTYTIPSQAEFLPDVKEALSQVLAISKRTNAPFVFDIFPIGIAQIMFLDLEFAYPNNNNSTLIITDPVTGFRYTNLFDVVYDSIIWAIKKIGHDDIKIVVGQLGWPTDGFKGANVDTAERFWKNMLPKVSSNQGTPMRPGSPIDIFIHALTDETFNSQSVTFSRHWGIYRSNGEPKYKIDLMGLGRDIYPTTAKGGNLMPGRWCVFNGDMTNPELVKTEFDKACKSTDCTFLVPGASCGMLTHNQNVSFAFNGFFQSKFQDERACDMQGLGKIVVENPSTGGCVFSVGVVHGNQPTFAVNILQIKSKYLK